MKSSQMFAVMAVVFALLAIATGDVFERIGSAACLFLMCVFASTQRRRAAKDAIADAYWKGRAAGPPDPDRPASVDDPAEMRARRGAYTPPSVPCRGKGC